MAYNIDDENVAVEIAFDPPATSCKIPASDALWAPVSLNAEAAFFGTPVQSNATVLP